VRAADLDAVTFDAHGTLVTLVDPVPALVEVLADRGVARAPEVVRTGFRVEAEHYAPRASEGKDEASLARLRRECARVFLDAVDAQLDADEFAPVYVGALRFEVIPGVVESLERLRALGLELAVVGNWDVSLRERLEDLELVRYFRVILPAARKPAPDGLIEVTEALGVEPRRALHIGDDEVDEQAARAAGMHFAPAPVRDAVAALEHFA
jgi:HAD superfamily hydrolase (TIGR01509 family)